MNHLLTQLVCERPPELPSKRISLRATTRIDYPQNHPTTQLRAICARTVRNDHASRARIPPRASASHCSNPSIRPRASHCSNQRIAPRVHCSNRQRRLLRAASAPRQPCRRFAPSPRGASRRYHRRFAPPRHGASRRHTARRAWTTTTRRFAPTLYSRACTGDPKIICFKVPGPMPLDPIPMIFDTSSFEKPNVSELLGPLSV